MKSQSLLLFLLLLGITNAIQISQHTSEPCNFLDTINITSGYKDGSGKYYHNGVAYEIGTFAEYDYILKDGEEKVQADPHIRGCICKYKPCIRVCCRGQNSLCVKNSILNVPTNYQGDIAINLDSHDYGVLEGKPCVDIYRLEPEIEKTDAWNFIQNGSIEMSATKKVHGTNDFCFAQRLNTSSEAYYTEALMCTFDEEIPKDVRFSLYPIGMLISVPFLIITFLVYAFVPELRNLHGKCLMCYVLSLIIFYISLCLIQLDLESMNAGTFGCTFLAYISYLSVFLCFFWLNVMCYDIWSTFRGNIRRGRGSDQKKFLLYSLYAFGSAFSITFLVFIIDTFELVHQDYLPEFGQHNCWIKHERKIEMIYVYAPITIIIIVNIILYSWTAFKIFKVQKETSVIRNTESRKHSKVEADTDRYFLYLRLFIIMGVTWSMESISWVFQSVWIFYVCDFLNCIQGLIIFILFVWKPKVKQLIIKRYRSLRKLPPANTQFAHTNTTTTSIRDTEMTKLPENDKPTPKDNLEKPLVNE
ncbi:hypothetical protein PVAND_002494 [Polypedilum vanderplanki]|uniref:G-protein coupled receptors family 2 profile 2 domain-containing protein n=1 Tax=Polypedilum vanderplanki TaxID=319348 RepID=A0A9J6BR61_POLVA|nr:hypothetical protein PVAND_002494 [Polypedilum vanderplanki]